MTTILTPPTQPDSGAEGKAADLRETPATQHPVTRETAPRVRLPTATYRLQLNRQLTFADAQGLVGYLHELGISDVYASPVLKARAGSQHGYDVVDHAQLNPELGTESDLAHLAETLQAHDMGLLVDVVPNHMCIDPGGNRWWYDVLENGPSSPFARCFDIDWSPPKPSLANRVLLPILGDQYGRVLDQKQIQVGFADGQLLLDLNGVRLPLASRSWLTVLTPVTQDLQAELGAQATEVMELESIATALRHLPQRDETDTEKLRERLREKEVIKRRLLELSGTHASVRGAIERELLRLNGIADDPRSFDRLETMLAEQAYRLCYWRVACDEINYRRFFDVNDLAAIRVEEPQVFAAVHELVLRLVERGWVTGLRIDHVDGLLDPAGYLQALATTVAERQGPSERERRRSRSGGPGLHLLVEKILIGGEQLPGEWPVHGTTGYEFLNLLNGLFIRRQAARPFGRLYARFVGARPGFGDDVYASKQLILATAMSSELTMLARRLERISEQHRWSRDFTLNSLQGALAEVIACFPVYRTYVRPDQAQVTGPDRAHLLAAVRSARRRNPATSGSVFDFIASVLLREDPAGIPDGAQQERSAFVARFQQLTGPVMAKGAEDTALYRHHPLASLNEVGGSPDRFGVGLAEFHRAMRTRLRAWPDALSASATHDTKRGEDVRVRLDALSEIPTEWFRAVGRWHALNLPRKEQVEGRLVPDANEEYLLYQTLVGTWPATPMDTAARALWVERMEAYLVKALREAKVHSSWIDPERAYEEAAVRFLRAILEPLADNAFLTQLEAFVVPLAHAGMLSSLSQVLIKVCAPGIPDFYQGCELWDLRLVDPDNRAPVDFALRRALLASLREADLDSLLKSMPDGRLKLLVTQRALKLRRARPELFARGAYVPLSATANRQDHVCAFVRALGPEAAIVVAARFHMLLGPADRLPIGDATWHQSRLVLPKGQLPGVYRDAFTGQELAPERDGGNWTMPLAKVFSRLPIALLDRVEPA